MLRDYLVLLCLASQALSIATPSPTTSSNTPTATNGHPFVKLNADWKQVQQQAQNGTDIDTVEASNTVDSDTNSAAQGFSTAGMLSALDAQRTAQYISNTLVPTESAAVQAFIDIKYKFQAAGLQQFTCNNLQRLQSDSNNLGTVLMGKTPTSKKSAVSKAWSKYMTPINNLVLAYCPG